MKNIYIIIKHIKSSNLPEKDKLELIKLLNEGKPKRDEFLNQLLKILSIANEVLDLFNIDFIEKTKELIK